MRYVFGKMDDINASHVHGWAVGHMQTGIAKTTAVEVKIWRYGKDIQYPKKKFFGTEFIVIFGGIITLVLKKDGQQCTINLVGKQRDYIILEAGITKRVFVKKAPAFGVTIRWPSKPGINQVLK